MIKKDTLIYLGAFSTIFLAVSMVLFPEDAFSAAKEGLNLWFNVVFPALLPFFIAAELLIGMGVVHFMGVLLEPIMRPVFNVPGSGSFVMAVGLASGFPIGSILTGRLRRQNLCNKTEGERLMSFANTADPLFMFGAVAVGMFSRVEYGVLIAAAHYLSCITVGIVMAFYKRNDRSDYTEKSSRKQNILLRALISLKKAKEDDGRPIGQLMGDAVKNAINTMLTIGGFIIIFSVLIKILIKVGFIGLIASGLLKFLAPLGVTFDLIVAYISGIFEVDIGSQQAALADVSALSQLVAVSFIIAFSGISVIAQVASMVSDTDLSIKPFICARVLHGVLAAIYTFLLVKFGIINVLPQAVPAFLSQQPNLSLAFIMTRMTLIFIPIILCLAIVVLIFVYKSIKLVWFSVKG
ncbi:sporulation integral membrane protein YlbJ [Alkalicella caledoniensis]|uniref:Sporulation integral membrane protein YlbJ n=1 Tax=Alkalicella caledoniensis TaxID=2731377 RepID=A0A7G9WCF5_ALKCA|nr:sporulation integral membrane protein YlbJ [Alkalicella caledoniensis]QNO16367.1 sporulation integral membrane protein YlbJ [Alkalicella caledoniensis]